MGTRRTVKRSDIPEWVKIDEEGRIWKRIDRTITNGYRQVQIEGRTFLAHRLVAAWFHRDVGADEVVCHLNDTPLDNRPENLLVATPSVNAKHQWEHGNRDWHGEGHPRSKLTNEQVYKIRELAAEGISRKSIAADFGITPRTASGIINREYWGHI